MLDEPTKLYLFQNSGVCLLPMATRHKLNGWTYSKFGNRLSSMYSTLTKQYPTYKVLPFKVYLLGLEKTFLVVFAGSQCTIYSRPLSQIFLYLLKMIKALPLTQFFPFWKYSEDSRSYIDSMWTLSNLFIVIKLPITATGFAPKYR